MCLVMALLAQPVGAVGETDPDPATRLQIIGLDEITIVTLLVCVAAIALWGAAKAVWRFFAPDPRQRRREARLRKLRESAATATRAELERLATDVVSEQSESSLEGDGDGGSADPPPSTPPRMLASASGSGPAELQSWLHVRWMRLCWPRRLHHKEIKNDHEFAEMY